MTTSESLFERARERIPALAVGHELDPDEETAPAHLADGRVVAKRVGDHLAQPGALRRAGGDEILGLEDPQHLAGDGGSDRRMGVREPVDEAGPARAGDRLVDGA